MRSGRLAAQRWTMNEYSESLTGTEIGMARDLDAEFEAQLLESSRLAFRIAYGVLRHREDAEDVAQEALTKAYRNFGSLRERNRFRPWLVRIVWRLAIDHKRACKRRSSLASASAEMQTTITDTDPVVAGERSAR